MCVATIVAATAAAQTIIGIGIVVTLLKIEVLRVLTAQCRARMRQMSLMRLVMGKFAQISGEV